MYVKNVLEGKHLKPITSEFQKPNETHYISRYYLSNSVKITQPKLEIYGWHFIKRQSVTTLNNVLIHKNNVNNGMVT